MRGNGYVALFVYQSPQSCELIPTNLPLVKPWRTIGKPQPPPMLDPKEEVKTRLDIVDLVSEYVALKPAGASHKAL